MYLSHKFGRAQKFHQPTHFTLPVLSYKGSRLENIFGLPPLEKAEMDIFYGRISDQIPNSSKTAHNANCNSQKNEEKLKSQIIKVIES